MGEMINSETARKTVSMLEDGCYYIRYLPRQVQPEILFYEGTLRIMRVGKDGEANPDGEIRAGGDLYCRLREFPRGRNPDAQHDQADPRCLPILDAIPVFPRIDYKYYLEVVRILEATNSAQEQGFTARFKVHEYSRETAWPNPGTRTVLMHKVIPSSSEQIYPPTDKGAPLFFLGKLMDEESGQVVGTISMGWIAKFLRRAHILVDRVDSLASPATPEQWREAFHPVKWQVEITERNLKVERPSPHQPWTVSELHEAMLQAKASPQVTADGAKSDPKITVGTGGGAPGHLFSSRPEEFERLDMEWLYHLFCVGTIEGFDRGVMYDTYGSDSNNVPREGAAIACQWIFPDDEPRWGTAKGAFLQEQPNVLRRVAVHEIAHAMGLDHNHKDNGFMSTTDAIAEDGLAKHEKLNAEAKAAQVQAEQEMINEFVAEKAMETKHDYSQVLDNATERRNKARNDARQAGELAEKVRFPGNIELKFHKDDLDRLRFGPDVTVRPGGEFDDGGPYFDRQEEAAENLRLEVWPLLDAVPLGAPVRVVLKLKNTADEEQMAPAELGLSSGRVFGYVIGPDGGRRTFWPLKKCVDLDRKVAIAAGSHVAGALTLLRGVKGALFPICGRHRIVVTASWECGPTRLSATAETDVQITPRADDAHEAAALKVLSTPDTLLSLVFGGEHLAEGNAAIGAALANEVLKPHFAVIEIKKAARSHGGMDPAHLIKDSILSFAEIERILQLGDKLSSEARVYLKEKLDRVRIR